MANPRLAPEYHQKNAVTYQAHRRQVIWQVYLPIAVVIVLVVLAAILVILAPTLKVSRWADIALIMLISIAMVSTLIILALNVAGIIGARRAYQVVPYYLFMAQGFTFRMKSQVRRFSDMAVEPVLWTKSNFARAIAILPNRKNN
jgi:hypothetical protein